MTPRLALAITTDHYIGLLRTSSRGTITAVVLGGYLGGVLAAAGGLVLVGVRIGRKIA